MSSLKLFLMLATVSLAKVYSEREEAVMSHSGANYIGLSGRSHQRFKRAKLFNHNQVLQSPLLIKAKSPDRSQMEMLLSEHNKYRSMVPASNMRWLQWDAALAVSAQRHANRCDFRHSSAEDRARAGENIWAAPYANYSGAVKMWFDEVYDPSCNCPHSYKHCCGHYTQVVWAETNKIGCGYAECSTIITQPRQRYILVCHYSPNGNIVYLNAGAPPYAVPAFNWQTAEKAACSECPQGSKCDRDMCY